MLSSIERPVLVSFQGKIAVEAGHVRKKHECVAVLRHRASRTGEVFPVLQAFRLARRLLNNPGMRKALWLLTLPLCAGASPAVAQSETIVVTSTEIRMAAVSTPEVRAAELEQAYRDAEAVRPRRGVIASSVLLAGGAGMLAGGISLSRLCFSGSACPDAGGVGAASLGAALMVGSAVGVIISAVRLKRAKDGERRPETRGALP